MGQVTQHDPGIIFSQPPNVLLSWHLQSSACSLDGSCFRVRILKMRIIHGSSEAILTWFSFTVAYTVFLSQDSSNNIDTIFEADFPVPLDSTIPIKGTEPFHVPQWLKPTVRFQKALLTTPPLTPPGLTALLPQVVCKSHLLDFYPPSDLVSCAHIMKVGSP